MVENVAIVLHVLGFFAVLIPLWVKGKPSPASEVFFTFSNGGGWSSQGLSCMVGSLSAILSLLGPDSAVHMSEELKNASYTLPRAMMATTVINGALGFVMIVTYCMLLGDVETILATPTGYPFIQASPNKPLYMLEKN